MRKVYLSNIDAEDAWDKLLNNLDYKTTSEIIEVVDSLNRVTSEAVFATQSAPNYNASAMDGIAVIAANTFGADETKPKRLTIKTDFIYVDTGDVIKEPYNSVIMIEDVVVIDNETIEIIKPSVPWQNVRPMGEDIIINEMIIPTNYTIRAVDMGALLSGGITKINVYKKPKIGILPTGTEIVKAGTKLAEGEIIDSNSAVFQALSTQYGGLPTIYDTAADNFDNLSATIKKIASENDIIVINAGSSAGSEDFTAPVIEKLGKLLVHGIATKPGKPTIIGIIDNKPVIGIPGYPVAAFFVFETFVKPLIYRYNGIFDPSETNIEAVVSKRIMSSLKHKEFVPVKLGSVKNKIIATPLNRGAGVTMSLVRADGLLIIDKNIEGYEAGSTTTVKLLRQNNTIEKTLVSIGSHDLIMDIINSHMQEKHNYSLSSSHVGSMGGIMALKRDEAHIAPIHLLDEETGIYNQSYLDRFLPNKDICLIKGVKRIQGFIVKKGNPKNINSFTDLAKDNISFVNRQRGAGTRILLDYKLALENIDTSQIMGYDREMSTHMAVAAAVSSGSADVGVGVYSAAKALDLDFIPIGDEDYDFAIEREFLEDNRVKEFLSILRSEKFAKQLEKLGGYKINTDTAY